jgi:hypothetical protein
VPAGMATTLAPGIRLAPGIHRAAAIDRGAADPRRQVGAVRGAPVATGEPTIGVSVSAGAEGRLLPTAPTVGRRASATRSPSCPTR